MKPLSRANKLPVHSVKGDPNHGVRVGAPPPEQEKPVLPKQANADTTLSGTHLTLRANGKATLVVGKSRFELEDKKGERGLLPTLYQMVRAAVPNANLPKLDFPGYHELAKENAALRDEINALTASHEQTVTELKQRLNEAEAAAMPASKPEES